jgi:hypothetical protein
MPPMNGDQVCTMIQACDWCQTAFGVLCLFVSIEIQVVVTGVDTVKVR